MQAQAAQQPSPPTPAPTPQTVTLPTTVPGSTAPATAQEMYEAMRAQKDVLQDQLRELVRQRTEIAQRLRNSPELTGPDRAGLEGRLQSLDARITQMDQQIAVADAQLARAAAEPGAVVEQPRDYTGDRLEVFAVLGVIFMFVCILPISFAYARRLWKKSAVTINLPSELTARLDQIERGVDATALEVERIGEGQRFVTQLLAARDRQIAPALPSEERAPPR